MPLPHEYCADHIELFFRDVFLGRAEMCRLPSADFTFVFLTLSECRADIDGAC